MGVKRYFATHTMIHGLLRISCSRNPKTPQIHCYFSVFCGSISHAFSCKHETHDLLTLVSSHLRDRGRAGVIPHGADIEEIADQLRIVVHAVAIEIPAALTHVVAAKLHPAF